jgi:hypothetical protein
MLQDSSKPISQIPPPNPLPPTLRKHHKHLLRQPLNPPQPNAETVITPITRITHSISIVFILRYSDSLGSAIAKQTLRFSGIVLGVVGVQISRIPRSALRRGEAETVDRCLEKDDEIGGERVEGFVDNKEGGGGDAQHVGHVSGCIPRSACLGGAKSEVTGLWCLGDGRVGAGGEFVGAGTSATPGSCAPLREKSELLGKARMLFGAW